MKIKSKLCALALAVALGCGALVACNKGQESGAPSSATPSSSQQQETKYLVNVPSSNDYTITGISQEGYLKGANVTFSVNLTNTEKEITAVGYDQTTLTAQQDGSYTFVMPEKNVSLFVSTKAIERYALSHTGSIKVDGDPVTFSLTLGTDPVSEDFTLAEVNEDGSAVAAADAHVSISGAKVTGIKEGATIIAAKINGEEKARESITVEKSAYMTIADAIAHAWENKEGFNDNSKDTKTDDTYKIRAKVVFMGNPYTSGSSTTVEILLDDGTGLIDYTIKSSAAITAFQVGDVIEINEKLQNYKGLIEAYSSDVKYAKKVEGVTINTTPFETLADGAAYDTLYNRDIVASGQRKIKPVILQAKAKTVGEKKRYEVPGATKGLLALSKSIINLAFTEGATYNFKGYLLNWNDSSSAQYTNFIAIEQNKLAATSVSIDQENFEIAVNTTKQLTYTTEPAGAGQSVAWTVEPAGKVTVDENGLVTANAVGEATIKLTVDGHEDTVVATVIEPIPAESAQFTPNTKEITTAESLDLNELLSSLPAGNSDDKNKQWSVNPADAGTLTNGVYKPAKAGSAVVTVKYNETVSASITITAREQKIADLAHAKAGDPVDLYGYIVGKYPASNVFGMWIADGDAGINVNIKPTAEMTVGKIVHVVGEVQVSHYISNGSSVYTGAKEIGPAETNGVTVVESHAGLVEGTTYELNEANVNALNEADFGRKATVSGKVTAHSGAGNNNHTITLAVGSQSFNVYAQKSSMGDVSDFDRAAVGTTATFTGFISAYKSSKVDFDFSTLVKGDFQLVNPTIDNVVVPTATGIALDKTTADVKPGETLQLTASVEPEGAKLEGSASWTVEGNEKVTVSNTGLVTVDAEAVVGSTATVKAAWSTFEATCTVTVIDASTAVEKTVDILPSAFTAVDGGSAGVAIGGTSGDITIEAVGTNTSDQFRVFKGKTMTIKATGKKISKIVIVCTANGTTKQGPGCFGAGAPEGYTFETDGKNGTWEGSLESVSFKATDNQVRITKFTITYK